MNEQANAICQRWVESERGWGLRPDGYSLHSNREDCKRFIAEYWAGMPDEVPGEYSRPLGEPYPVALSVPESEHLAHCEHGVWMRGEPPPEVVADEWPSLVGLQLLEQAPSIAAHPDELAGGD